MKGIAILPKNQSARKTASPALRRLVGTVFGLIAVVFASGLDHRTKKDRRDR
jgi:hypothetical protein